MVDFVVYEDCDPYCVIQRIFYFRLIFFLTAKAQSYYPAMVSVKQILYVASSLHEFVVDGERLIAGNVV